MHLFRQADRRGGCGVTRIDTIKRLRYPALLALAVTAVIQSGRAQSSQTFAPHEQDGVSAPPAIEWESPLVSKRPPNFDSAEERRLRLVTMTRALEQPWSMAFLPDGSILVTERPGRLRIIRKGVLDPRPISGVPAVSTEGARGLQGLMDVVLHPDFNDNHWVYLTYHKPVGDT